MAVVALPATLAELFPGCPRRVDLPAATVGELIAGLEARWPGMHDRICEGRGPAARPRAHLRLFVDGTLAGLETPVRDRSLVHVLLAISGG